MKLAAMLFVLGAALLPAQMLDVDVSAYRGGAVTAVVSADALRMEWPDESGVKWSAVFSRDPKKPLIASLSRAGKPLLERGRPVYWVETGKRRGGFDQFFDFPPSHPDGTRRFQQVFQPASASVRTTGDRVEVRFSGLRLGIFAGDIAYTFFPGSRLIQQEAVVSTSEPDTAFYYNAGFEWNSSFDRGPGNTMHTQVAWHDTGGKLREETLPFFASERHAIEARYRTAAAKVEGGTLAVFPAPHQYFMPRDFTSNLGHVWARSFRGDVSLGIRQLPDENWVYYPWMNAPPGTEQRLSLFLQVSDGSLENALGDVARYTNRDRFPALDGYKTLASHFHFAYTVQAMEKGESWTPPFKTVLESLGIDAAMIADFHGDGHPRDAGKVRLRELDDYYRYCRAQSGPKFLMIPAEEANVHFGGHYVLAFPKKVRWIMSRADGQPFEEDGVYRTANDRELLDLVRKENGLVYTAHPRTKGSLGFPDKYRGSAFFLDPHFLGAGWKQMPADLSTRRLGIRALNLLDDMQNWGLDKRLLPEVDVFQMDTTHEVYAHMNAAYVRMAALPSFDNYGALLDKLRAGDYFSSTGEVLLPQTSIRPGIEIKARVKWTFPLAYAVVIHGDGQRTERKVIPLADTRAFGDREFTWKAEGAGAKWARLEVWDVAGNGAFTTPVRF